MNSLNLSDYFQSKCVCIFMKGINLILLCLLFVSCGAQSPANFIILHNDGGQSTGSISTFKWANESLPLYVHVPQELQAQYETSFELAANAWNDALGTTAIVIVFDKVGNTQYKSVDQALNDPDTSITLQETWSVFPSFEESNLAVTVTQFTNSGIIYNADIFFNVEDFNFATAGFTRVFQHNIETVLIHELGHLLGLKHSTKEEDSSSVMLPTIPFGATILNLSDRDITNIKDLYSGDI
jgi:hypothetical protein